jgi:hypothetical protein
MEGTMFDTIKILDRGTLTKSWEAFVASPEAATASALADALKKLAPANTNSALKDIATTLATGTSVERSQQFLLISTALDFDLGRNLLRATAEVVRSAPEAQPVPQHQDVAHSLDLLEPKKLTKPPVETPGGRNLQLLEALDLAAAGEVTVDLIELERRADDVRDVSTWAYLRKALAVVDGVTGMQVYSKVRRNELAGTVLDTAQEHIVEQIGFRAAKSQRVERVGLSAQNDYAVTYWRTNFTDNLRVFGDKLQKLSLGKDVVLVNSPRVLPKLGMMVDPTVLADLTIKQIADTSGISILGGTHKYPGIDWGHILRELGATPSAYQLYELIDAGKPAPKPDFRIDTWADLMTLITSSPFSRLQEMARGKGELAPVCAMVEHLVLGLADMCPKLFDPLTASALRSLSMLLDIVVVNEPNPSVAMRAVDLMMDEIGIVVAAADQYTWPDYRNTMRQILLERAPSIKELTEGQQIEVGSHLMTSGMDALGTALWIALSSREHGSVSRPTGKIDYYETESLLARLRQGQTATPREDVLVAALNPSTPFDTPSAETLVTDVQERLRKLRKGDMPVALILDTTIEVAAEPADGKAQLDLVLDGLKAAVADGRLEIFLCKSFQKYASFGTGKVAAGDLTMLSMKGNLDSAYARWEALMQDFALDLGRHDEGQLVIHMLKYGHRDELALIRSAARNAKFVNEFCWPIDWSDRRQGSNYVNGIPLILRSTRTGDVDALFRKLVTIDQRDSFSFLRTSYVGGIGAVGGVDGPFVRINTGHESRRAMVEYFYAFGHLASGTPTGMPSGTPADLSKLTPEDVQRHLAALTRIVRYRENIVASYCAFAVQNVEPASATMPMLITYFTKPMGKVTIETQRYLARELFKRVPGSSLKADSATLGALCRAAEVLPAWELKSTIRSNLKSKLDGFGSSPEAERLRKLVG